MLLYRLAWQLAGSFLADLALHKGAESREEKRAGPGLRSSSSSVACVAMEAQARDELRRSRELAKQDSSSRGEGYVRADSINLADIDAALERHLSRNRSRDPQQQGRRKGEWEVDLERLVLKRIIGRGSYGTVYLGALDGQDVAVKLLNWGEEGRISMAEIDYVKNSFMQEVAVWHKLDHPNVTKFIGASMGNSDIHIHSNGQNQGDDLLHLAPNVCCVIVEYLAGGSLKNFLIRHRRRKLALKVVVQIALDISRGLKYLHSCSIVHRDVKTENMLLDKKMKVKIADFGVARVEAQNPEDMTGETGTLGYMAPEVLNGQPYDRKCDVYSFGICLWEIYCCDMPYPDLSFAEMTTSVVKHNLRPPIPRCCPNSLASVMKKCWDPNPERRPKMEEVVSLLEAVDTSKGGGMIPMDQPHSCFCFVKQRGP